MLVRGVYFNFFRALGHAIARPIVTGIVLVPVCRLLYDGLLVFRMAQVPTVV